MVKDNNWHFLNSILNILFPNGAWRWRHLSWIKPFAFSKGKKNKNWLNQSICLLGTSCHLTWIQVKRESWMLELLRNNLSSLTRWSFKNILMLWIFSRYHFCQKLGFNIFFCYLHPLFSFMYLCLCHYLFAPFVRCFQILQIKNVCMMKTRINPFLSY